MSNTTKICNNGFMRSVGITPFIGFRGTSSKSTRPILSGNLPKIKKTERRRSIPQNHSTPFAIPTAQRCAKASDANCSKNFSKPRAFEASGEKVSVLENK